MTNYEVILVLGIPFGVACLALGFAVGLWWNEIQEGMKRLRNWKLTRGREWLARVKPWLPQPEHSYWARWKDISPGGSGGFHLGPFIDWESGFINVGLDLGFWSLRLIFEKPHSKEGG